MEILCYRYSLIISDQILHLVLLINIVVRPVVFKNINLRGEYNLGNVMLVFAWIKV